MDLAIYTVLSDEQKHEVMEILRKEKQARREKQVKLRDLSKKKKIENYEKDVQCLSGMKQFTIVIVMIFIILWSIYIPEKYPLFDTLMVGLLVVGTISILATFMFAYDIPSNPKTDCLN